MDRTLHPTPRPLARTLGTPQPITSSKASHSKASTAFHVLSVSRARSSQILLEFTDESHKRETVYRAELTMLSKDLDSLVSQGGLVDEQGSDMWMKKTLIPAKSTSMTIQDALLCAARRYLLLVAAYLRVPAADVAIQDASKSGGDGKHQAWYLVIVHTDEAECDRTLKRIGDGVELGKVGLNKYASERKAAALDRTLTLTHPHMTPSTRPHPCGWACACALSGSRLFRTATSRAVQIPDLG